MSPFAPLLAANDAELVKVVIIIVFGILVGIAKFFAMVNKGKPPAAMGQRPVPPPPPVANMNAPNEIEEFMRRAAAKPRPAANAGPIRRSPQPQLRPPVEKPVQAQVLPEEPVGARIGKEVERDLDTQEFTKRTTELGSEVSQADREIDQRLHQVFDHHVSNLELMPGEAAAPPMVAVPLELTEQSLLDIPATFATGLTDLLVNPDSVRQAVVLNEIIHRPEERW
jgi:hypothetical protein